MLFVAERWQIIAQALFTGAHILAEHPDGLRGRELWLLVTQQLPDVERDWAESGTGRTDAYTKFSFESINLVKAGWLRKPDRRWYLTSVGRAALDEYRELIPFYDRYVELYHDWDRNRTGFERALRLVKAIPEGAWAAGDDLSGQVKLEPRRLLEWLQGEWPPGWHRVLDADGGLPDDLPLSQADRNEWMELLEEDGIALIADRADPAARILGIDLSQLPEYESATDGGRRAWLIRGSSVQGVNLIYDLWLREGVCSLPASRLRDLPDDVTREDVKAAIDVDYSDATVQQRARMTVEYHAFLSRIREGDIIATNDGAKVFLGVITGRAGFRSSNGNRANLQRAVAWRNKDSPADYADLPDEISARLGNPDAELIDLTEFVGDLEQLIGDETKQAQAVPDREMHLPGIDEGFAKKLYMPDDRDWLQECVELLRDRPQLIFYGPPGTGKTHLTLELADYLVGGNPQNVQFVQFHPAYSYEDFFQGFRPEEGDDGTVAFRPYRGPLRLLADAAAGRPGQPHVLIIDEINRGNMAKIFGELYFLLEYRHRPVRPMYGSEDEPWFTLPRNLLILGTMNTVDRSIAIVDAAIRRRFWFKELHPDVPPVKGLLDTWLSENGHPPDSARLLDKLNEEIGDRDFKIGPSFLMRAHVQSVTGIERVWRHQILPLLEEHHFGELNHDQVIRRYDLVTLRAKLGLPAPGGFAS
jgi:5-methylcytosine-specific restriction enzyme B